MLFKLDIDELSTENIVPTFIENDINIRITEYNAISEYHIRCMYNQ